MKWLKNFWLTLMYGEYIPYMVFSHWDQTVELITPIKREGFLVNYDPAAVYNHYVMNLTAHVEILCDGPVEALRLAKELNEKRGQ